MDKESRKDWNPVAKLLVERIEANLRCLGYYPISYTYDYGYKIDTSESEGFCIVDLSKATLEGKRMLLEGLGSTYKSFGDICLIQLTDAITFEDIGI